MRRIIDTQLHPQISPQWEKLTELSFKELAQACNYYTEEFPRLLIESGLMFILNPDFLKKEENVRGFCEWRQLQTRPFAFGCLLNFRERQSFELLEKASELGFVTLKFHPYIQEITDKDFESVALLAQKAESLGMYLTVCGSYGTRALYRHSGTRLAAFLSEKVKCPIIIAHAGGAKLHDAALIADSTPNVFLNTSFFIPYYLGSSLEQDLAFLMKKLGTHRWMYGSDSPYVGLGEALEKTMEFMERHRFTNAEQESFFYGTAKGLLYGR